MWLKIALNTAKSPNFDESWSARTIVVIDLLPHSRPMWFCACANSYVGYKGYNTGPRTILWDNSIYLNRTAIQVAQWIGKSGSAVSNMWENLPLCIGHVVSPAKTAEPIEMPFGSRTSVGQRNQVLDGVQIPHGNEHFERKERFIVKTSIGTLCHELCKTAEPIDIYRLGFGLGWAQTTVYWVGLHTGITWRIPLNCPCAAAMWPVVNLLWSLDL